MDKILKLEPFFSKKVWGYEKWNLSTHPNGESIVAKNGKDLSSYLGKRLPILIKIIKAEESLSVQVHPDDKFARKYEGDNGKTECWYILEAEADATLICGIKSGLDKESFAEIIKENQIEAYLDSIPVKAGDMVYIPAGTVHAIKGGIKLLEIQQSSDVTYRLYDWGRNREMHIQKGIEVIDYRNEHRGGKVEPFSKLETPYFRVEKVTVCKECHQKSDGFQTLTAISGRGIILTEGEELMLYPEDTVYIEKGVEYSIKGNLELIRTY
ncbi:MAG: mannose-6-phosphate isomerase [Turicibacter sp.]|nr:mannose-6-phosphate isomerase [Turicibacter sp.]